MEMGTTNRWTLEAKFGSKAGEEEIRGAILRALTREKPEGDAYT